MKVAIVQLSVLDGSVRDNVKKIKTFVEWAKREGAKAVFFPELALTGFSEVDEESVKEGLKEIMTVSEDITLGLGSAWHENDKKFNAYLLIRDGDIKYVRKKYLLFEPMNEHKTFEKGGLPEPLELDGWKFAFPICYELRFPELFGALMEEVEVFVVPASWPRSRKHHWETLLRARAIESVAYVIGVNRWGPGTFGPFAGGSAATSPDGVTVSMGDGEGILVIDLEKEVVKEARRFPSFEDRIELMMTSSPRGNVRTDQGGFRTI